MKSVKIAILGCGTVGAGVADVFAMNADRIAVKAGRRIEVKYILDIRDLSGTPYRQFQVEDFSVIEADPEIEAVVETIGGAKIAYEFTKRALSAGKSVVTSNKELVASCGDELMALARANNVSYLFEASVGGGIPLLHPIDRCLSANELTGICGILNGTTNFILTKMIKEGIPFSLALKQAKDNGYAEADPTDDVEGKDACRKTCILASMLCGRHIRPELVPAEGITRVSLSDVHFAASAGYKIKLLGRVIKSDGGRVAAWVAPHLVREDHPLACVEDVFNAVMVSGNAVDDVMFYGRGAGKMATASAVASDVIDIVSSAPRTFNSFWEGPGDDLVTPPEELLSRWYVCFEAGRVPEGLGESLENPADRDRQAIITSEEYSALGIVKAAGGRKILSLLRVL
ncbi:MAG: homoserine dehydrogenase [Oscillospiraceae bacterium]|nr:homoserine dehydrogenase [Oscillospiraceae bacterium]